MSSFVIDLFCRVIDNYGDAGVCLRLSRALVLRYDCSVRLWCDAPVLLQQLEPLPPATLSFYSWEQSVHTTPAQAVVCGFGCALDEAYLQAMAAMQIQPIYLHLEYLSAEPWVENTHGLWSVHPRLGLRQRFCNPGFTANTAGLLHEIPATNINRTLLPSNTLRIFFFGYPTVIVVAWINAARQFTRQHGTSIHWVLPQSAAGEQLHIALQHEPLHCFTKLPFVSQQQFDAVLRSCDLVWVRGEDSAVTAIYSGLPMLWQLYPQDDGAQHDKMQAYIDAVQEAAVDGCATAASAWRSAMQVINSNLTAFDCDNSSTVLFNFLNHIDSQSAPAHAWARHCRETIPDLTVTLANYLGIVVNTENLLKC